jgi:hypothetical protein
MSNMHKVPVHLDTQDVFLWHLTFKQVLVIFMGGGLAYLVATIDWSTPIAALLCLFGGGLCLVVTLLATFVKIARRDLDQWLVVAFLFYSSPRLYSWSALEEGRDTHETAEEVIQEKGEEW